MTLVLSQIVSNRVFMASDSAETVRYSDGTERLSDVEKTVYFEKLNIGISTWGNARVGNVGINRWLKETLATYEDTSAKSRLTELTRFIAQELNREFRFPEVSSNQLEMGLHIGGFETRDPLCKPGLCHVYINENENQFRGELTRPSLRDGESFFLRNGMYEPFAAMWSELLKLDEKYRTAINIQYLGEFRPETYDPIELNSEWLGGWVKQFSLTLKTAGFPEYVGKAVRVITFDNGSDARIYELPEMKLLDRNFLIK